MRARTETQWLGSRLGMVAKRELQRKRMINAERDADADVSEESHAGEGSRAGVRDGSARQPRLAGDEHPRPRVRGRMFPPL